MHSVDASIRYELMLYIDMHIPLVIEINTQIETNKRIYENNGTLSSIWNKLATPYFDENKRFNYSKMSVLTDTHFLTEYNGEAIIQKLHPSIDLFDGNHGIFHEGMLQDVLTELSCCSFFTDKRPDKNYTKLERHIVKVCPRTRQLLHLRIGLYESVSFRSI